MKEFHESIFTRYFSEICKYSFTFETTQLIPFSNRKKKSKQIVKSLQIRAFKESRSAHYGNEYSCAKVVLNPKLNI